MAGAFELKWDGLKELRAHFAGMPRSMAADATPYAIGAAWGAATEMKLTYPRRTGFLADSVTVDQPRIQDTVVAVRVRNTAYYSGYFEFGTRFMAPGRVFYPAIDRHRRMMYADLIAALEKKYNLKMRDDDAA